jgi:PAS domain S-box-containing protein
MISTLRRLLLPPAPEDQEKTRILRLLNIILLAACVVNIINTLSILLFAPQIRGGLWISHTLLIAQLGMLYIARRGYVQQVAFALCMILWLALTWILTSSGGLANSLFSAYAIIITIAAILLGTRGAVVFGVLCILTTVMFWLADQYGGLPVDMSLYSVPQLFTNYSTVFLMMTVLLSVAAWQIRHWFDRSRQSERKLIERNRELERAIAQEKQVHQALIKAEHRYRTLFENAVEGIFQTSPDGYFLMANPALARMLGYPSAEVLMSEVTDIAQQLYVDPSCRDHLLKAANEKGEAYNVECQGYRRDGSIILASIGLRVVKDEQGNVMFYEGTVEDITQRKQIENALRESEARFRSLFERAPLGIAVVDHAGYPVMVNREFQQMLGYDEAELLQMRFGDFTYSEDIESNMSLFDDFWADKIDHYQLEKRYVRKDGSVFWVRVNVSAMPNLHDKEKMVYSFVEDITEWKQAQAQEIELAVAIERERVNILRQFLRDASHDLRTPLTTINTSLYLLRKTVPSERQNHYIDTLELQARRIQKLIDDLFLLTRLDIAETEFEFMRCDLNELVNQVGAQYAHTAAQKHHAVHFELDQSISSVQADGYMLNIAFGHLIINALNFTPDHGQIIIKTALEDSQACVEIQDSGEGISQEDLPHIFDRFYRADKARQTDNGGFGLGLTIAKKIITAHRGEIEVKSEPGQGSTFRVRLPMN